MGFGVGAGAGELKGDGLEVGADGGEEVVRVGGGVRGLSWVRRRGRRDKGLGGPASLEEPADGVRSGELKDDGLGRGRAPTVGGRAGARLRAG